VDQVPDGMALSAYRIVQEALTNVVKHAAPAQCQVEVSGEGKLAARDRAQLVVVAYETGLVSPATRG
jgi:signal transduction histidine kinase